jgi:hypothetical protein
VFNFGTLYLNVFLHFVLLRCETLFLASREERMLRVFGNRMLKRIIGPKRGEVIRG